MRLLVWNIHKGIGGLDGRYAPGRITAVLQHYDPDVVALQEVDDGVPRSGGDRQVDLLGDVISLAHRAWGPNVRLKRGCYGNATLSRWPITHSENVDLQFGPKKPRGALITDVQVEEGEHKFSVHVVNLHLGLSGVERRWQARRLLDAPRLQRLTRSSRLVIAGDTNDWAGALPGFLGDAFGLRCVTGRGTHAVRTFPAFGPMGALDRVFVRGEIECTHHSASRLRLAREASDHLPLVVDLRLRRHPPGHRREAPKS
jgi:endonuclease/exonuclease/phosphatase family metal-dependent hydrolase